VTRSHDVIPLERIESHMIFMPQSLSNALAFPQEWLCCHAKIILVFCHYTKVG